jgi:Uma2 family endonuclease
MSAFSARLERMHRITLGEYRRMMDAGVFAAAAGTELIDGMIVDVGPHGSRRRAVVAKLEAQLRRALPSAAQVSAPHGVVLMDHTAFRPDLCVLRSAARAWEGLCTANEDVVLVVEAVESDPGEVFDLKLPVYASAAIPEVWVIDAASASLTACRQPARGRYRETMAFAEPGPLAPGAWPRAIVDLPAIFAGI